MPLRALRQRLDLVRRCHFLQTPLDELGGSVESKFVDGGGSDLERALAEPHSRELHLHRGGTAGREHLTQVRHVLIVELRRPRKELTLPLQLLSVRHWL